MEVGMSLTPEDFRTLAEAHEQIAAIYRRHAAGPLKDKTTHEACIYVLTANANESMKSRAMCDAAKAAGWNPGGLTPWKTMEAHMATHPNDFERTGPGLYRVKNVSRQ